MKNKRAIISACVLIWLLCQQTVFAKVFDESQAVRYQEYTASHTIEDATLYIGTYLIHLQALTDELYEKALESASDSNQMNVYYKSELASGTWIDITDASGLMELSGQGRAVEETELSELWVTCYTGSDGITRDARDEHVVNIFSEPSPYDLYNLKELEPLKIQYSNVFSPDSTGVDRYYFKKLRDFFSLDVKNEITEACDVQLLGLQGCYESLRAAKQEELAEIVSKLMSRVDARRRAEIFYRLSEMDGNELSILQDICAGSQFYSDGEKSEDDEDGEKKEIDNYDNKQFVENASVIDAVGVSLQNCQESYITYSGNMLEEGSTVLKNAEYRKSMAIVEMASGGYSNAMEELLWDLKHLYDLQEDIVADADAELRLLNEELINQADVKYTQKLTEGAKVADGVSEAVKEQVLDEQKAEVEAARLELQYLLKAKTKRQSASDGAAFSYQRITYADGLYGQVPSDDFQVKAKESIDAHMLWLKELARQIEEDAGEVSSTMQKLEQKKTKLLAEQTEALDNNDLSTVKKYETMIESVDKEIEAAQKELAAVLSSSTSSAADRAKAANLSGDASVLSNINQTKDAALLEIAEGNGDSKDSIANKIDALSALGAESAIQEIKEKLEASGSKHQELIKKAEEAMVASRESSLHGLYGNMQGDVEGSSGEAFEDGSESADTKKGTDGVQSTEDANGETEGSKTGENAGNVSDEAQSTDGADSEAEENEDGNADNSLSASTGTKGNNPAVASLTEEELLDYIEMTTERTFDNLSDTQKAAAIAALYHIGQSGNKTAAAMAKNLLSEGVRAQNPWLYQKLKKEATEYLPLRLIADSTGYRYIFSDSKTEVTLSKKLEVYHFTIYREEISLKDGEIETLVATVKVQDEEPYLSEADAIQYFACEAEYIENTNYGICLGPKVKEQMEAILKTVWEGAK